MPFTVNPKDAAWQLPLRAHLHDVGQRLGQRAPAIQQRIEHDLIDHLAALDSRRSYISGASDAPLGKFQRDELRSEHLKVKMQLRKLREATVVDLEKQEAALRAATQRPRPDETPDVRELRFARLDRHADRLRALPPEQLTMRVKTGQGQQLEQDLEALRYADEMGFPVPAPEHRQIFAGIVADRQQRLVEEGSPQLGELRHVREAYEFALACAGNVAREWSEKDGVDVWDLGDTQLRSTGAAPSMKGQQS